MKFTQGLEHHPLVPSQYKRGEPSVKGFRGCGLVPVEEKEFVLRFLSRLHLGKCLTKMAFHLKEASKGLGPFDACHRDTYREPSILIHWGRQELRERRNKTRNFFQG